MKPLFYSLLLLVSIVLLPGCLKTPANMWKCTATDASQQHWTQYSLTRVEAATRVKDRCQVGNYLSTCIVRCSPPTVRWHCVAVDKGGHTWYWNSTNRTVAIRNARNECLKNTTLGSCRVPSSNCSMSH